MRKISAMYQYSGGTDCQHMCSDCVHLVTQGKYRKAYKCLAYGETDGHDTDWKPNYIACRHFGLPLPEKPLLEREEDKQDKKSWAGQISIFDFPEFLP